MSAKSRIYFNPVTKELEIEGSEEFIKTYFAKLQQMPLRLPDEVIAEPKAAKALPVKKEKVKKAVTAKAPGPKKATKAVKAAIATPKKVIKAAKGNLTGTVIDLIKGSPTGIALAELMEKTGLGARQIISITSRVAKQGKIKRAGRGTYMAIG